MEQKKLFDFSLDDTMDIFVLIKGAEVRLAKNGKKFIAFNFSDKSGEISAKFWDASNEDIDSFREGQVVKLNGKRENYQGKPQIKIFKMRLATDNEPKNPELYLQSAPESAEKIKGEINDIIFQIVNPKWNRIVRYLLNKYHDQFFEYPAAKKNHHAFTGGLAYHTVSMLRLAQAIAKEYDVINASLLYAGVLLHDLGKIQELSGNVATKYTLEGNMIGHIVLVDEEIIKACEQLKIDYHSEDVILLRHMILSHHGLLEYGSPVRPHILEAEVLHQIDQMDASIQMMKEALGHTNSGEFSERIFGLDGRNFYKFKDEH